MAFEDPSPAALEFTTKVEEAYNRLIVSGEADRENGLGGKLFYAGELDEEGRVLVVAANIAGAATLAVTPDRDAQKQAIRDGVADFLVNSLDEALRILKNELRKRGTVAVCVGLAADTVEREVTERGVLPDLRRTDLPMARIGEALIAEEGKQAEFDSKSTQALVIWRVAAASAQWLPALDALALECLDANAWLARRWLQKASHFLGRPSRGMRLISADREFAARFIGRVRGLVGSGEIPVGVEIRSHTRGMEYTHRFEPRGAENEG